MRKKSININRTMQIPEHVKQATLRELGWMFQDARIFEDTEAGELILEELKTRSKNPGVVGFPTK